LKKKFARKNKLTYVIAKFSSKIENLKVWLNLFYYICFLIL
jgi:hypothetical protein